MMFQYSHIEDVDDNTYDADDDAFSIHILEIQMVIVQYSHTEDVDHDGLVVDVLTKPLSQAKFKHFQDKLGEVQKNLP